MSALDIKAMTTSFSTKTIFFATATAVYRMHLESSSGTMELLAGEEGTTGGATNEFGARARFSSLTALAVDLDGPEAGLVVVGDGQAVRVLHVFSREVVLVGTMGDVHTAGGIALRRDTSGTRWAYVSDVTQHRIMGFNLENFRSVLIAGDAGGFSGMSDGFPDASFFAPRGLVFLEKSLNASKLLLVADSGNNRIRVIDTDTRVVSTWFAPMDQLQPELVEPIGLVVALADNAQAVPMLYVTDAGGGISVIQFPVSADRSVKVLTRILLSSQIKSTFVHGALTTEANNAVGYAELLVLESGSITTRVQSMLALSSASAETGGTCHLPCMNSDCSALTPAVLCGNSFLDAGEQCDNGFSNPNTGCNMSTCQIREGFACPVGMDACNEPYVAYRYASTGVYYREADCLSLTPTPGYTIDGHCVETDIDECVEGTAVLCDTQAKCVNTAGAYACECFESHFGDGHTCRPSAVAVYAVVDIPSIPRSAFAAPLSVSSGNVLKALENAYAQALSALLPANLTTASAFTLMNASTLALAFTSSSIDPAVTASTRLELVTLFEFAADANAMIAAVNKAALQRALSQAIFALDEGVTVFQKPKVRAHRALGFTASNVIDGWGMNITSVTYNRTCTVEGVVPTGGCWQVEMIYVGGQELPQSNQNANDIEQSKNVLYIPRLDHDPVTMELTTPVQGLTMASGMAFPCDVASASAGGRGITPKATACCLRNMEAMYRPHAGFKEFVESATFSQSVPSDLCVASSINDTFPESNVVFKLPSSGEQTNDLVVGRIEGMPHSEVRLLETIDYTTRTFRVLLMLEEGDLRTSAAIMDGVWGLEYNLTFFVGLANFKGTGTSILNTRNAVQFITVSKSSVLTISTFGANQDPLVSSVDMQLFRVKVTDFFRPVSYLYYLRPVFTMPNNFKSPPGGTGIVPSSSIRLIKTQGLPSNTDPAWMQACSSSDGEYVYANSSLQALVQRAQTAPCVLSNMQMCYPPSKASNVVTFGIPLPIDFIEASDYSVTNPYTLTVQFVIQAFDTVAMTNIYSTLSLTVDITPMGFTSVCETMSAAQNLADIIEGNIYIGTATNDYEWDALVQKKTNMDVQGTTPSNSFEFATTTVQGSVMTFAALGDPKYFEDPRSLTQEVHMHDIHTVHFLEPLGDKSGPSPNFDAVKALFFAGNAFVPKVDPMNHSEWLEPSKALLNLCPYRATAGKMACLTRTESTFKNTQVARNPKKIIELRHNDSTSVAEMQALISEVIMQGGVNDFTQNLGEGFYQELSKKLALNNRYRKVYVINPIMDWSFEAMQFTQKGSTAYTVSSKIIAIGMITIRTPDGTQLARRLLSTELHMDGYKQVLPRDLQLAMKGRRALLSSPTDMGPSMTQTGNAMVLHLEVPGYDATSQLCGMVLGASYDRCNIVEIITQVRGVAGQRMCASHTEGTLGTALHTGLVNTLREDGSNRSHIEDIALLEYSIEGCGAGSAAAYGRRLFSVATTTTAASAVIPNEYVFIGQKAIVSSVDGRAYIVLRQLDFIQNFLNSSTYVKVLGGGGYISTVTVTFDEGANNGKIVVVVKNVTNTTKSEIQVVWDKSPPVDLRQGKDTMFVYENTVAQDKASSPAARVAVVALNVLVAASAAACFVVGP
jgi:cysteine-rich repeat protein